MSSKKLLVGAALALTLLIGTIALLSNWLLTRALPRTVALGVRVDGCVACHGGAAEDPGGVHAAARIGCASCHLGHPEATDATLGHEGMEREPGALQTVERTCGRCHAREAKRVASSLMTTGRGIVAVDRWAFGEIPEPSTTETLADVLTRPVPSPAEDHLRRLCAGCHLGTRRGNRDDAHVLGGSGCSACHSRIRATKADPHPPVLGVVPDDQCLGCHSRSARISLSFQGLAEISPATRCDRPVRLFDGRAGCRLDDDVHHARGMSCIDCHLHTELMGDGISHARARQQLEVRCESCHGPATESTWSKVDDPITRDLLRLRSQSRAPDERVRLAAGGTPLWNLRPDGNDWKLLPKAGGPPRTVPATPDDADHRLRGHERLGCAACHSAWIPSCPTCHTEFDPKGKQWDFGRGGELAGAWRETDVSMHFALPGLALSSVGRIEPAAPGMTGTLDATAAGGSLRRLRLVSAFDPHTTRRQARDCGSCHRSAAALGLGSGTLELTPAGPRFTGGADGWTELFPSSATPGTAVGARGLTAEEQRRILSVGVCVECHDAAKDGVWRDFAASLGRLRAGSTRCKGKAHAWLRSSP